MSIRNLDCLFKPQSIALIGASKRVSSVGSVLAKNLFGRGFDGPIMPVNPKHRSIQGVLTFEDVENLPLVPDLAVIATPPNTVPGIIHQLGERGTKAAVVITAGLNETGAGGASLKQVMLDAAKPHLLRGFCFTPSEGGQENGWRVGQSGDLNAIYWQKKGFQYVLVGYTDPTVLAPIATRLHKIYGETI